MALYNDTKHDRFCKSVTEIKDHAKNFPNAPRIYNNNHVVATKFFYHGNLQKELKENDHRMVIFL